MVYELQRFIHEFANLKKLLMYTSKDSRRCGSLCECDSESREGVRLRALSYTFESHLESHIFRREMCQLSAKCATNKNGAAEIFEKGVQSTASESHLRESLYTTVEPTFRGSGFFKSCTFLRFLSENWL